MVKFINLLIFIDNLIVKLQKRSQECGFVKNKPANKETPQEAYNQLVTKIESQLQKSSSSLGRSEQTKAYYELIVTVSKIYIPGRKKALSNALDLIIPEFKKQFNLGQGQVTVPAVSKSFK